MHNCPLCQQKNNEIYYEDRKRQYYKCGECSLIFVPAKYLFLLDEEKAIYDMHENDPNDQNYRKHLDKLANPLAEKLKPNSCGLDFGSGPGPTLSLIFEELGHDMKIYDPIYADDKSTLKPSAPYDFITMSEVIEHIYEPHEVLPRLWNILKPDGIMGIMTSLAGDQKHFQAWHYKNDPTHICFYSKETFIWLAKKLRAEASFVADNVMLLRKNSS